ncbi:hypothetical protein AN958_07787 [Leucoagaricus sp. SymC.cos]|nr:hypothetical protein AN958_07787 [Leucoagaricus sp. SymC.cos]
MLRNRAIRPIFEKYPSAHTHEITDEDENGLERLSNASSPNAFHDSSARHPPPRCHPGTRLMQLENLARWAVVGEKRLLWLKGPAGVGKSAIAQTLAEAFELESRLGAAFFFSRPNRIDDAQRLFPSIAFQLSQRYAVYAEALERRIRRDPSIMAIPLLQQFRNTIVLPLQGVVDVQSTKLVVIIDGLDECQGIAAQMEIVQIIASSVRDATTPLLWVFTSRPESHLAETFTSPDVAPLCLNVDVHDSRADVECFLIDKLRSIRQRATNLLSSQWPSMEAINVLVDLSHGRFIFASTAAILMDYHSSGQPDRLLENILELEHKSISNSPVSPMSHLDDLYTLIVNQVPIGSLSTAREILLASTLPGICTSAVSIANLLRVSEPQLRESLRGLRPFVSVVSTFTGPEVCFYHASFLDFLEDPARSHSFSLIPSCVVTLRNKLIRQLEDLQHIQQPTHLSIEGLHLLLAATNPDISLYSCVRQPAARCHKEVCNADIKRLVVGELNSSPNTERLVWIYGPMGVGKSANAQTCAEALDREGSLAAAVFLSQAFCLGDAHLSKLLPTIVYQIAMRDAAFKRVLGARIRHNPAILNEALPQQFHNLLLAPLQDLASHGIKMDARSIIIDEIDRCGDTRAQRELITLIAESIRQKSTPFRWVFFSRKEARLQAIFTRFSCTSLELKISRELDPAISAFLSDNLNEIAQQHGLATPWPPPGVVDTLLEKSGGFPLYASSLIHSIQNSPQDPSEPLQAVLNNSHYPLPGVDGSYLTLLGTMTSQTLDLVQKILLTTLILPHIGSNPISVANFLGITEQEFNTASQALLPVLRLVESTDNPQIIFYHPSFMECMQDPGRSKDLCLWSRCAQTLRAKLLKRLNRIQDSVDQEGYQGMSALSGGEIMVPLANLAVVGSYENIVSGFFALFREAVPITSSDSQLLATLADYPFAKVCLAGEQVRIFANMEQFLKSIPITHRPKIIRAFRDGNRLSTLLSWIDQINLPQGFDMQHSSSQTNIDFRTQHQPPRPPMLRLAAICYPTESKRLRRFILRSPQNGTKNADMSDSAKLILSSDLAAIKAIHSRLFEAPLRLVNGRQQSRLLSIQSGRRAWGQFAEVIVAKAQDLLRKTNIDFRTQHQPPRPPMLRLAAICYPTESKRLRRFILRSPQNGTKNADMSDSAKLILSSDLAAIKAIHSRLFEAPLRLVNGRQQSRLLSIQSGRRAWGQFAEVIVAKAQDLLRKILLRRSLLNKESIIYVNMYYLNIQPLLILTLLA